MVIRKQLAIILPSRESTLLSTFCALILLLVLVVSADRGNLLADYLFGKDASPEFVTNSLQNLQYSADTFFSSDGLGRLTVFSVWMAIGLCVYALLSGITRLTNEFRDINDQLHHVNGGKELILREQASRFLFRIVTGIVWAAYMYMFLQFIIPYTIASITLGLVSGFSLQATLTLLGFFVLTAALHVHVILLRLFVERIRIFGSDYAA